MTINLAPYPKLQFFASNGSFLSGGKLYTYAAGTTTPLTTYTDYTASTPQTNPVILDSRGEASVWLGQARYKFVLKDNNDVEIWTQDNIIMSPGADGSGAYGTWSIDISGNAATATTATYATTAGIANAVAPGAAVTSINGAGLYGFSLTGGPITSSGTLTVTPPAPGAANHVMASDGTNWVSLDISGLLGGPAFSVYSNVTQTVSIGVYTKITLDTKIFDTNTNFDNTTNYRFTPTVAGYYQISGGIYGLSTNAVVAANAAIYKNGSIVAVGSNTNTVGAQSFQNSTVPFLVYLDGLTDYLELYGYVSGPGSLTIGGGQVNTYMTGALVRSA